MPFLTLDISEGGPRFQATEALPLHSMVEFFLKLPGQGQAVKAHGQVDWIVEAAEGGYQMALTIMDIDRREYLALTRCLRKQVPTPGDDGIKVEPE